MTKKEVFSNYLPKWTQMRVIGEPVSEELAKEIIIRTDSFFGAYHTSNSDSFDKACRRIFGIPEQPDLSKDWQKVFDIFNMANNGCATLEEKEWSSKEYKRLRKLEDDYIESFEKLHKEIGYIRDEYICNNWFSSCYILGPHGWMNPDGTIGYIDNIGKYPDVESVYNYWVKIAKEWPMLNIRITLMDGEDCNEHGKPVVTMKVSNGKVHFSNKHISDTEEIPVCRKLNNDDVSSRIERISDFECWWTLDYIRENILPTFNRIKKQRAEK